MMKKILSATLLVMLLSSLSFAAPIDKTIKKSGINREGISISVKNVDSGKVVYKLHEKRPVNPASTQKIITFSASFDTLKDDYEYSTKLYKNSDNELFLQLGGDPFLTTNELNQLIKKAAQKGITEPKTIYIDDTIFDLTEWNELWPWGDDLLPSMPKVSSYNIDSNKIKIIVTPTQNGQPADIYIPEPYPVITYINLVTTGNNLQDVEYDHNLNVSPDTINITGVVNTRTEAEFPIKHPKRYFIIKLENALKNAKISYYKNFEFKKLPKENVTLISEIKHPMSQAVTDVLKNSNNLVVESTFKLAGERFTNEQGSILNSQKMLNAYFEKYNIDAKDAKFVDGCGVSKDNIVTTDFMTDFLVKSPASQLLREELATPGEGTLQSRMLYFKDNLRAKTGTLSDLSCLTGYITTQLGNTYAFSIVINDVRTNKAAKKSLEEHILRTIYEKY